MTIPILRTERLMLRAHRADDFDACAAMWADPAVVKHIGGQPSTPRETWMRMLRYPGLWKLLGFGYWAIEDAATGTFIGEAGLADFKRDLVPSIAGMAEVGWALAPSAHGKGYATEAVAAIVDWADRSLDKASTVCIITPDNTQSIRVAEKCGFSEVARSSHLDQDVILFRRPRAH